MKNKIQKDAKIERCHHYTIQYNILTIVPAEASASVQ